MNLRLCPALVLAILTPLATQCKSSNFHTGQSGHAGSSQPNSGASDLNPSAATRAPAALSTESSARAGTPFPVFPGTLDGPGGDTPLIVDLSGKRRIRLADAPRRFDIDGDGQTERIDWLDGDSGFIALDINNNGRIDSGRELFGSATVDQLDFKLYKQGFAALAAYDVDKNGVIDAHDPVYAKLLVWRDRNSNARTDAGELRPLMFHNIVSLNVANARETSEAIGQSTIIFRSTALRFDGASMDLVDIAFQRYQDVAWVKHAD